MVKKLLPAGCYDVLPPLARQESLLASSLLLVFEAYGYEQVSPPLLEYSDHLLAGRGAALSAQIFRVMDPGAHRVMGIRPDITLQIARIAETRLSESPRPLRLCYNGSILRMQGEQLKNDRQLRQTGIELIGAASPVADAEVITVAAEAVQNTGVKTLSIDLNLPGIIGAMLATESLDNETLAVLFDALSHKDIATLNTLNFSYRESVIGLIRCAGEAKTALAGIERLDLPDSARKQVHDLREVVALLEAKNPGTWTITIDAAETHGFDYHSGIGFSMFVPGVAYEIGRGGRYRVGNEEATGFTLYVETLRSLLPPPPAAKKILVANGDGKEWRDKGYVTLHAIHHSDYQSQAKTLGCEAILIDGKLEKIS